MKQYDTSSADYIKCKFIDYFINRYDCQCIGSEVMYGINKKMADLIFLSNGKTYAIEIKSKNDNLLKIQDQISNYCDVFDYVIVVTTKNHINNLMNEINNSIGVFLISDDFSIQQIQRFTLQRHVKKQSVLSSINANYLRSLVDFKYADVDDLRLHLSKKSKPFLKGLLYDFLLKKLNKSFFRFLEERGAVTHIEDLGTLSQIAQVE